MRIARPLSIYVWEFSAEPLCVGEPPPWLGTDDSARWRAMGSARRRREFVAGRRLMWHALRCRRGDARGWRLVAPPDLPPRFESLDGKAAVPAISLSHSAAVAVCAIGEVARLGIDVERCRPRSTPLADLARSVLHPAEQAAMADLDGEARLHHFYRCWTLKEALGKALGVGLGLPLTEFAFAGDRLVAAPGDWQARTGPWRFATLAAAGDTLLSVAWTEAGDGESTEIEVIRVADHLERSAPAA